MTTKSRQILMLNTETAYSVSGYPGIAWHVLGYVERDTPDTVWDDLRKTDESQVRAVMVGDDRVHIVDIDDLIEINDEDYCSSCGQIGCFWH